MNSYFLDPLWQLNGPQFLFYYFLWFLFLWGAVLLCRAANFETKWLTIGGLILFEGTGLARFVEGSSHGLHRWAFLFIMMIVGLVLFVIRFDGSSGGTDGGGDSGSCSNSGTWWSSSSSCSSGGGCGGGGCGGGCGGCGGG